MNTLPPRVESYIMQRYPDMTPAVRQQLLRYTYADREDIMMEVLGQAKENLLTLSHLITQRLDTRPRITTDDLAAQLSADLPQAVAHFVAEHFPNCAMNVKRQLLRLNGADREALMLEALQKSKNSLWILTQHINQTLEPSQLKDQPRKHYSQYGEYESDRLFTALHIAIQDAFEEAHWEEAYQLISALQLDESQNRRVVRESEGQIERLRARIKREAASPQPPKQAFDPGAMQRSMALEQAIASRFPTQKVAVKRLLARYPDHKEVYNEIVEQSGGDWDRLQTLFKSWQDDDTAVEPTKSPPPETRLQQAVERFFPQRKAEVMEVLNRYHGKNAMVMRAQLVERSGGQFLDLLAAVDQRLFPVPAPYRRLAPANGPVWLDWVENGDPRDALMALTPASSDIMKAAYEARVAEGDAAYKAAARAFVPAAIQELVAAQIESPAQQEEILSALEHYSFGSTNHRAAVFRAILQQTQAPEQVLEMVFYQKLGLRTYAE